MQKVNKVKLSVRIDNGLYNVNSCDVFFDFDKIKIVRSESVLYWGNTGEYQVYHPIIDEAVPSGLEVLTLFNYNDRYYYVIETIADIIDLINKCCPSDGNEVSELRFTLSETSVSCGGVGSALTFWVGIRSNLVIADNTVLAILVTQVSGAATALYYVDDVAFPDAVFDDIVTPNFNIFSGSSLQNGVGFLIKTDNDECTAASFTITITSMSIAGTFTTNILNLTYGSGGH